MFFFAHALMQLSGPYGRLLPSPAVYIHDIQKKLGGDCRGPVRTTARTKNERVFLHTPERGADVLLWIGERSLQTRIVPLSILRGSWRDEFGFLVLGIRAWLPRFNPAFLQQFV